MKSSTTRLDRFISQNSIYSMSDTRLLVAQKKIIVDGDVAHSTHQKVTQFMHVELDGHSLQDNKPIYIMLNKPQGIVSATKDSKHTTVLDLIDHPQKDELHIVGRLDFNTTGLVLLTNDGAWSRQISLPETKLAKVYEVTLSKPVTEEYITVFKEGIYFRYENITTKPAHLEIISEYQARLSLVEGKYHQVKRMFGFFQNEVLALHRVSVGHLLVAGLESGQYREFSID
ncbi:16S rRNA pseudouridine(516) synthase [Photobacterium carnosum]|uniref:pseudouridine synthase n=1 Tax=Photobacterium carnosum TaxID=2023717 RepID=UPI001C920BF8|nr:16S rRNA pseudouridine(516) synthase [Photobacterium carnosum]MBY3790685.1 16S rRNA pseudouridine(516) synthase [Photobacterium carnosum]MCD9535784.1 pseudouridine synthase [Photobacterium carnosum]